jgi:hypothetical protein
MSWISVRKETTTNYAIDLGQIIVVVDSRLRFQMYYLIPLGRKEADLGMNFEVETAD